jgi:hypothetical protein
VFLLTRKVIINRKESGEHLSKMLFILASQLRGCTSSSGCPGVVEKENNPPQK